MKKLMLSLVGAATMALSSSAMALDTTAIYQAFVTRGPIPVPVGTLYFEFSADVPGHFCQYAVEWDNAVPALPLSGQCFLDEAKTHGNFSCIDNSLRPVPSVITIDPLYPDCYGFDYFQQFRKVFVLMLGEDLSNTLQGLVQFTGAVPIVYGFAAHP
jgi:hypothetical protein